MISQKKCKFPTHLQMNNPSTGYIQEFGSRKYSSNENACAHVWAQPSLWNNYIIPMQGLDMRNSTTQSRIIISLNWHISGSIDSTRILMRQQSPDIINSLDQPKSKSMDPTWIPIQKHKNHDQIGNLEFIPNQWPIISSKKYLRKLGGMQIEAKS